MLGIYAETEVKLNMVETRVDGNFVGKRVLCNKCWKHYILEAKDDQNIEFVGGVPTTEESDLSSSNSNMYSIKCPNDGNPIIF